MSSLELELFSWSASRKSFTYYKSFNYQKERETCRQFSGELMGKIVVGNKNYCVRSYNLKN
jgi:hypothetical protein